MRERRKHARCIETMAEQTSLSRHAEPVFHVAATPGKHIVDELIEERCPDFVRHVTWPVLRPLLYSILGYGKARAIADEISGLSGRQAFDWLAEELPVDLRCHGKAEIPAEGACTIVANHPTGLADGIAMWQFLREIRRDVVFFANADALRVGPHWDDIIIPVEWLKEKRTTAKARETLRRARDAYAKGRCVVIFPSGVPPKEIDGAIQEQEWFNSAISLTRKHDVPLVPVAIDADNSWLYFRLSRMSRQLRAITLFREMINKKGKPFEIRCAAPVSPNELQGDAESVTRAMRSFVTGPLRSGEADRFQSSQSREA